MGLRVKVGRALIALGSFIQSLPVVVMRADDLVEFSRQGYARPQSVDVWAEDDLVNSGLTAEEQELLAEAQGSRGDLLLLGVGGGREAIPLARMGYRVTGVDYVPAMVDRAKENASRQGVSLEGLVQDISRLELQPGAFDVVWLSRSMYSCVPTRARRVEMARRIARALKADGKFLCQFHWNPNPRGLGPGERLRRLVALLTLGNLDYQAGDRLWLNVEFVHEFSSEDKIRSELEEGGLEVIRMQTNPNSIRGWAVCGKKSATSEKSTVQEVQ